MSPTTSTPLALNAISKAWAAIRLRHPDVPTVELLLASGGRGGRLVKRGHYARARWCSDDGEELPEVLIAAEILHRGGREVFHVLLHEAAHGLAEVRGIEDTSRQGRYHNHKFAELARELGLRVNDDQRLGCRTELDEHTLVPYAKEVALLDKALCSWRKPVAAGKSGMLLGECACGRKLRGSAWAWSKGPVICGLCKTEFRLVG